MNFFGCMNIRFIKIVSLLNRHTLLLLLLSLGVLITGCDSSEKCDIGMISIRTQIPSSHSLDNWITYSLSAIVSIDL